MPEIIFEAEAQADVVTVVVPTYRKERYIGATLASIGRQSYVNWELVIVEDGDNPGSEAIVRRFANEHPSHRIVYACNGRHCGAAHTRNIAFAKARGEYVALLDSDDRWFPDHLAAAVAALRSEGADIAYSTVLLVEDQTERLLGLWGPDLYELDSFPHSLYVRNFVTPSATVMRRTILEQVGEWDRRFRYCEDADFWMRCVAAGARFQHVNGCHCLYRKNHEGATTQRLCATLEEFAQIAERYIKTPGLRERACRKNAWLAYLHAAERHLIADPLDDPSADPSRASELMFHAWRMRPRHVECLFKGIALSVMRRFRRRPNRLSAPRMQENGARQAA
jgi:glycosyltransferase involved in cell wall biosynthesis